MADQSWQGDVSVFAFDIVGYSQRPNDIQLDIKSTTEDCLEKAGARAEQTRQREWTSWADAGDGGYLLMGGDPRKALEVLEAFVALIERHNKKSIPEYRIELRYALNYGPVYSENDRLTGNAINDCARLLDGMKKYTQPTGRVVASGTYKSKALEFGQVLEGLFTRLRDIEDKHGNAHEVWNVRKLPGYGREPAPEDLHRASLDPPTAATPSGLPGRGLFVGRKSERAALVDAILGIDKRPIAVLGPAGIGKSTLTRQALHDARVVERYGARRWFVQLDTANDERALWTTILAVIAPDTPGADPAVQVLARLSDGKGLLVLDNLETPWNADEVAVEEALARLAGAVGIRVVASIRGTAWPARVDWLRLPTLDALPTDKARELFLEIAGESFADDPNLDAIVTELGGIPLACTAPGS